MSGERGAASGDRPGLPRRTFLGGALAAAGAAGLAGVSACRADAGPATADTVGTTPTSPPGSPPQGVTYPFHGAHQAGITTPPQHYASWVGLRLAEGADRDRCRRLLALWTDDMSRLVRGAAPLTDQEPELAAVPAGMTVTVGVGPGFFQAAQITDRAPSWLAPLPSFPIDRLEDRWGQSDVVLQICADSPVAVAHAQRRLVVGADPFVTLQWVQRGFREPMTGATPGLPFRNLFGQVDGTVQPDVEGDEVSLLWIGAQEDPGLAGGTSMVLRRIAMHLDAWDRADRAARENAIGRRLATGAPLTGTRASDMPDLLATDELGFPVIDPAAHMRRAMPGAAHERILRRPYSYDDLPEANLVSNSGLVFVAFQADPVRQFLPIQQRLAEADVLNLWTTPIGSAIYAVLPGAQEGEILGRALLRA